MPYFIKKFNERHSEFKALCLFLMISLPDHVCFWNQIRDDALKQQRPLAAPLEDGYIMKKITLLEMMSASNQMMYYDFEELRIKQGRIVDERL